jgi:hypothetical protein
MLGFGKLLIRKVLRERVVLTRDKILIDRASWFALFGFLVGTHIPE